MNSSDVRLIRTSAIYDSEGLLPARVIMWQDDRNNYVTHVEVFPSDRSAYLVWGHYDMTMPEATKDFAHRIDLIKH